MGEVRECYRYLGATLVAAVSTFLLATAQKWGTAPEEPNSLQRFLIQMRLSMVVPPLHIVYSVQSAIQGWRLRRAIADKSCLPASYSRLMADCPIYIEGPASCSLSDLSEDLFFDSLTLDVGKIDKTNPLQILPRMIPVPPQVPTETTQESPQVATLSPHESSRKLMKLSLEGKALLLILGLVPKYHALRPVRSKSGLEMIVFALQASGYLYGTIVRMVEHLPVSPLEYLITILSIEMLLQTFLTAPSNISSQS